MNILSRTILGVFFGFSLLNAAPYMIDKSHSDVSFSVKHLMISNVKGNFSQYEGEIDFDPKSKTFNKLSAVVKANSVDTGIVKRDNHLKSADFFYAEKFPDIIFNMKTYKDGKVIGELTMRGITKEVMLEVDELATIKDFKGNNRVGFSLKGKVNRMDYDLKWNKALEFGGVAVGEDVKILIEIEAIEK